MTREPTYSVRNFKNPGLDGPKKLDRRHADVEPRSRLMVQAWAQIAALGQRKLKRDK
jgi:hypothetical protein